TTPLADVPGRFGLVAANIQADVLIGLAGALAERMDNLPAALTARTDSLPDYPDPSTSGLLRKPFAQGNREMNGEAASREGAALVLGGILVEQGDAVVVALEAVGMRLRERLFEDEWCAL